jgi:hypothetical protein
MGRSMMSRRKTEPLRLTDVEEANMAGNGKKVKKGVHAHEKKMHPGKPLTKMPFKNGNGNGKREAKGKY